MTPLFDQQALVQPAVHLIQTINAEHQTASAGLKEHEI